MQCNPSILECYSGNGLIYDGVRKLSDKKISVTRIDIKKDREGAYLCGDNRKYLKAMDLSAYNIIDLDAYGIPFDQIDIIMRRQWHGILFVTHIQSVMGTLPNKLLNRIGITRPMISKCPTLFSRLGLTPIKKMFSDYGSDKLTGYFIDRKSYFFVAI